MSDLQKASVFVLLEKVDVLLLYVIVGFAQNLLKQAVVIRMLSDCGEQFIKKMRGT